MTDPSAGELARNVERIDRGLKEHLDDCTKQRGEMRAELTKINQAMAEDRGARIERQQAADRSGRRLQWAYWLTGIAMAALALLQFVSLWQRTGSPG